MDYYMKSVDSMDYYMKKVYSMDYYMKSVDSTRCYFNINTYKSIGLKFNQI